jgi:hypothetical protein
LNKNEFLLNIQNEPIISAHSHHMKDPEHHALNLESLLQNSYVSWCHAPIPDGKSAGESSKWLDAVRTRSYFVWLEKALMALYGINKHLDADTWDEYDQAIRQAHRDKDWHLTILREKCRYEAIFQDAFWQPGDDNGHPDLFRPVYRVNSLFYGYNRTARDHNGNNFQLLQNQEVTDIDEYISLIDRVLREKKRAGCVMLKSALAYDRSLKFGTATREAAQKAMKENPDETDVRAFQDYVFTKICEVSAELSMPFQVHTGLGLMVGSDAMQLQPLIARNPDTTFILMHGGYPWTGDIAGLTHNYPNVWADLCWLPLISSASARRLLDELIDVCGIGRVIWGCDTRTGEESYGARLAFLEILSGVLCERVDSGMMRECDARRYAKAVLHDNAAAIMGNR